MFQYGKFFRFWRRFFRIVDGKQTIHGQENIVSNAIYVTHHQNLYGPVAAMAWFPMSLRIWALHVFFEKDACFKQFHEYTFTKRMGWGKFRSKVAAKIAAPLISKLLKSGGALPVYRGRRSIFETIRLSVDALRRGESLLISPDVDYANNASEVKEIYLGFLNLEKYYLRETGRHIPFIPLYCNREQHILYVGKAVCFADDAPFGAERQRVAEELKNQLNEFSKIQ